MQKEVIEMAYLRKKGKNYFVTFYYRGQKYEKSCHTDQRSVGETIRKQIEAQLATKAFRIEALQQPAIKGLYEFTEDYLAYSRTSKSKKTTELDELALRNLKGFVGNVPIDSISTQRMEQFKSKLLEDYSPTSVNMIIRCLKAAFAKAVSWKHLEEDPLKGVTYLRLPEEDAPFMTLEDIDRLRRVMDSGLYRDFIETALYTGMRLGEIINLSWTDLDFVNMKIRVKNTESFSTKSKKDRTVPLHPMLADILSLRSQVDHSPLVFLRPDLKPVNPHTANDKFKEYCKKAGLDPHFHFHSLRHTFASHLAMSGVSLYFIQKILGHRSIETTTRIYAHLQPEPLLNAVKALKY